MNIIIITTEQPDRVVVGELNDKNQVVVTGTYQEALDALERLKESGANPFDTLLLTELRLKRNQHDLNLVPQPLGLVLCLEATRYLVLDCIIGINQFATDELVAALKPYLVTLDELQQAIDHPRPEFAIGHAGSDISSRLRIITLPVLTIPSQKGAYDWPTVVKWATRLVPRED